MRKKHFGSWVAGGNSQAGRQENDFYRTPPEVTFGLLLAEGARIPRDVWEPACGEGHISEVLERNGLCVQSTDLIARGYGKGGINFLTAKDYGLSIITNPPFEFAAEFISHAHALGAPYIALLLKATYWHAVGRSVLYERLPPSRIYALTWRPDFLGGGSPTMDCIWCVWDDSPQKKIYGLINRPPDERQLSFEVLAP